MEYTNETFEKMRNQVKKHFDSTMSPSDYLFKVDIDSEEFYQLYLDSFPEEIRGVYRERAWHDCSVCRHFLRVMGNVVSIDEDYELSTLFSFTPIKEYEHVFKVLEEYILKNGQIKDIFCHNQSKVGVKENFERLDNGEILKHNHFFLELPQKFVLDGKLINTYLSTARTDKELLLKSIESISIESIDTILELIESNTLYRGQEWYNTLKIFKVLSNVCPEFHPPKNIIVFLLLNAKLIRDIASCCCRMGRVLVVGRLFGSEIRSDRHSSQNRNGNLRGVCHRTPDGDRRARNGAQGFPRSAQ